MLVDSCRSLVWVCWFLVLIWLACGLVVVGLLFCGCLLFGRLYVVVTWFWVLLVGLGITADGFCMICRFVGVVVLI